MSEKKPLDEAKTSRVLADVLEERRRQHEKWGEQNLPDVSAGDLELISQAEEIRFAMSAAITRGEMSWGLVLLEEGREALDETDIVKKRAELVQVAAVAVQWIEAIDRRAAQQMDEAHERSLASLPPHQQAFARIYEEAHRNRAALERHFGPPPRVQVCPPPGQVVAMDFPKFEHSAESVDAAPRSPAEAVDNLMRPEHPSSPPAAFEPVITSREMLYSVRFGKSGPVFKRIDTEGGEP